MLAYSYTRQSLVAFGTTSTSVADPSTTFSATQRATFAEQSAAGALPTLSPAAIAAMTDPRGIQPVVDVALEIESNRLRRTTTTTFRRGDTLAGVGVLDAAMDATALSTGRRNPSRRFAIADASIADDSIAFDPAAAGDTDERPVAADRTIVLGATVPNAKADTGGASWSSNLSAGGAGATITPTAAVPDGDGNGLLWRSAVGASPAGRWIGPTAAAVVAYLLNGRARDFTATAAIKATGGPFIGHFEVTVAAGGPAQTFASPPFTVAAGANLVRVAAGVVIPATAFAAGTVLTTATWRLVAEAGTTATSLDVDDGELYAGPDRGSLVGLHAAAPTPVAVIEQTWTGARQVDRVEVTGERRAGKITSAYVRISEDGGASWPIAGQAWGAGRLAIILDRTYAATGIRVYVEETSGDPGGVVWAVEVDPMLVRNVTDDVGEFRVTWRREADPGNATIPVGNYQAASLSLTLDNTSGDYTPAANASIGTGHRLELGVGVRFANLLANPRAELDVSGWTAVTRGALVRAFPAPTGAVPSTSALSSTFAAAVAGTYVYGQIRQTLADVAGRALLAGQTFRAAAYVRTDGGAPGDVDGYLEAFALDSAGNVLGTLVGSYSGGGSGGVGGFTPTGSGWGALATPNLTAPAGTAAVAIQAVMRTRSTSSATLYATAFDLEALDGAGNPIAWEELVPAGVFLSDPWDAPSDATAVTLEAVDRLGRFADVDVEASLLTNVDVGTLVRDLALLYLDLDDDQISVASSSGAYVIPFASPTGNLGTYFADIAKAVMATLYVDAVDRLTLSPRGIVAATPAAELRADNALIRHRRPPGLDTAVAIVEVTGQALVADVVSDLWALPSGGIQIPVGTTRELIAPYDSAPAQNGFVTGITADGAYTLTATAFYSDHAVLSIRNDAAGTLTIATLLVRGNPLVATEIVARRSHTPTRDRIGPRNLPVSAPLVQTDAQLGTIADALLDAFRGFDDNGQRRIPDVEIDSLGLLHLDLSDRVTVVDPAVGLGTDYTLTSRELAYQGDGALLLLNATGREAPQPFAIADVSIADDVFVAGY